MKKPLKVLLLLLLPFQTLTSQEHSNALYEYYVQAELLPNVPADQWTQDVADESFLAFLELLFRAPMQSEYDLLAWLYNKGVSDEVAMLTFKENSIHLFYILLREGFRPPKYISTSTGEEKLLINSLENIRNRHFYVINKLLDLGYEANLYTLNQWRRNEYALTVILNHPTNSKFVQDKSFEISRFLIEEELLFKVWNAPLVSGYNAAINSLLSDIAQGNDERIVSNLSIVFDFYDSLFPEGISSAHIGSYSWGVLQPLNQLMSLAVNYDRAVFFEVILNRYPQHTGIQRAILNGGYNITKMILDNNPIILDDIAEQENLSTSNTWLVVELLRSMPGINLESINYVNTIASAGVSKELQDELLALLKKNADLRMEATSIESIQEDYRFLSAMLEAIINDDVALISELIESTDSYPLIDACISGVLSAGSMDLIVGMLDATDLSEYISEDYMVYLAHNPNNIDYEALWEAMEMHQHQLMLWGTALAYNDEDLIDLLTGKGLDISEFNDVMITLPSLPGEKILYKAIEEGMSVSQRFVSPDYTQTYRLLPLETITLYDDYVLFEIQLIYYAITKYPTDFAIKLIDLWADEALENNQHLTAGENILSIAVKANRKEIVEHILSLGVSPLNFQGKYKDAMQVAIKYQSTEVLELILREISERDPLAFLRNMLEGYYDTKYSFATLINIMDGMPDLDRYISTMSAYEFYTTYYLNDYLKTLLVDQENTIRMFIKLDDSFCPLSNAILNDNEPLARFIVNEMPQLGTLNEKYRFNEVRSTIRLRWFWLAEILINDNPDLLNKLVDNNTLLHAAVRSERAEAVEFLLGMGADPNIKNSMDETAYELFQVKQSSFINYMELENLFVASGASIADTESQSAKLMAEAVTSDDYRQVIQLYRAGADPNGTITHRVWGGEISESYINYASRRGQEVMALHLLLRGANPNCSINNQGLNPLSLALLNNNYETARILIQFGANIEFIPDEKAQEYFGGIKPGMTIKQWLYDIQWAGARLFQGGGINERGFEKFEEVLHYESPDSLIALLNDDISYLRALFEVNGSDYLNQVFEDKPFEYTRRVFLEAQTKEHPMNFLHTAAGIGRDGLVDLMLSLEADKASLYQLESPHHRHNIFEYNIKMIIESYTDNNSLIELTNYTPSKQYPPLSQEEKKAMAYCIRMHSMEENLDTTAMTWNFSRALMHKSPEVYLTLLENYDGIDDDVFAVFSGILNGDISSVRKLIEDGFDPNFSWYGCTLLNWAAMNEQTDIAQLLLEYDIEVTTRRVGHRYMFVEPVNRVWKAPAAWAIITQNKELAKALNDNGERFDDLVMSPSTHDPEYEFLFCYALESGQTEVIDFFIDEGFLMYDYGHNLTNILNRTIKYDNPNLTLKLMEGFGQGETHQAYIDAGSGEYYTAAHSLPTTIWSAISHNSTEVIKALRGKFTEFNSIFYTTESLNIAISSASWGMALDIMSRGIKPDNTLTDYYRVRTLIAEGTPEVYEALRSNGWDKRRVIRESRRVEPSSIVRSPEWIRAYMQEGECVHVASQNLMKAMSATGNLEHLDVFLSNRGMWHSSRSFEINRTYLSDIDDYEIWHQAMERIIAHERARVQIR